VIILIIIFTSELGKFVETEGKDDFGKDWRKRIT